jgi:hypothetical protein
MPWLKVSPDDDDRRNGLSRRQPGTGDVLREADGFIACTGNRQQCGLHHLRIGGSDKQILADDGEEASAIE